MEIKNTIPFFHLNHGFPLFWMNFCWLFISIVTISSRALCEFPSIEPASVHLDDDYIVAFVVVESSPMYVPKDKAE